MSMFKATFGPGKYFIGDICYALPDEVYDNVWGKKYKYEDGSYEAEGFAVHRTAYGDGCYHGSDGVDYAVDAGVLGITKIDDDQRYDNSTLNDLGKIVEVRESISIMCTEPDCTFTFTVDGESFEVPTQGYYEDDEEFYDEHDEDDDYYEED